MVVCCSVEKLQTAMNNDIELGDYGKEVFLYQLFDCVKE